MELVVKESSDRGIDRTEPAPPKAKASTIVPVDELADTLREDGRLLRMFVAREQHLKSEARGLATKSWLIPGDFYDEWLEAFVSKYAPVRVEVESDLEERMRELRDTFKAALTSSEKQSVEALEARLQGCSGDVYKLRDTLLAAVKDLSAPRRKLGMHGGTPMTEEALAALRECRQVRLRDVVMECLKQIWTSGVGGEVLRLAMENVRHMIQHFERIEDDICTAKQGPQWHRFKELMAEIEGKPLPALEDGDAGSDAETDDDADGKTGKRSRKSRKLEGKGTKSLIDMALTELGGQATTQEIFTWVENHPDVTAEHSRMRVNQNVTVRDTRKGREGKEVPVWHGTLRTVLCHHYAGTRIKGRGFVWHRKGEAPLGVAESSSTPDLPALADAPPKDEEAGSLVAAHAEPMDRDSAAKPNASKKRAAPKRCKRQPADAEDISGTPASPASARSGRKRDAASTTNDGSTEEPQSRKRQPKAKDVAEAADPLSLALDQAIAAASLEMEQ